MSFHPEDTICAIATAAGGAARGIVRVSGPHAISVAARLVRGDSGQQLGQLRRPTAIREALEVHLRAQPQLIPCDLFVWPTRRSYTRQPVVELHTLGSPPVLEAIVADLCAAGARLAEPGEFTLRAFLAGRIDLTQAEAVLGVVDAHSSEDLATALSQLAGGLARPLHQLRDDLLSLLADVEAGLDFVEEDIEFVSHDEIAARLDSAGQQLAGVADQLAARQGGGTLRQVVLIGQPNAGKSSLFNALIERFGVTANDSISPRPSAIVSPISGTTRDYLTATIAIDGLRFELVDTAGISDAQSAAGIENDASDEIIAAAQRFGQQRSAQAAVRAHCVAAPEFVEKQSAFVDIERAGFDLLVFTKCDLLQEPIPLAQLAFAQPVVATSSIRGDGIDELASLLRMLLARETTAQRGQAVAATAARCRESIRLAQDAVLRASELAATQAGHELLAIELRTALYELGKVAGTVYTDDVLDRIFSRFCVGK